MDETYELTEPCVVSAPKSHAFKFLSNIENLPKWSTEFVKKVIKTDGKYKAITTIGEVFVRSDTAKLRHNRHLCWAYGKTDDRSFFAGHITF